MTHKQYLTTNAIVSRVGKKYGARWVKQYSYYGPKSRRTKLWWLERMTNRKLREMCNTILKIPTVASVEFRPWYNAYGVDCPDSLWVQYV